MVAAKFGQSPYDYLFSPDGNMKLSVDELCYDLYMAIEKQAREKYENDLKAKGFKLGKKP